MKKFLKLLKDASGASAAEYALILAIVGAAIALAAFNLGGAIKGAMDRATECIESADGVCAGAGSGSGSGSGSGV